MVQTRSQMENRVENIERFVQELRAENQLQFGEIRQLLEAHNHRRKRGRTLYRTKFTEGRPTSEFKEGRSTMIPGPEQSSTASPDAKPKLLEAQKRVTRGGPNALT